MQAKSSLSIVDYSIFLLTLSMSMAIGIYFGCFGSKQKSTKEYLYGSAKMKGISVGMSLYSSAISAISIIGTTSEVYVFGTQFLFTCFGALLSLFLTWNILLPIFCGSLNLKTPYEYFELRFNKSVRLMLSTIYIIHTLLYVPVVLYASTLNFSEASNIDLTLCISVIGGVCLIYTMLGGFVSVVWTDTLQASLMVISCLIIMFQGLNEQGGIQEVWHRAEQGGRIQFFNMNPNPFTRLTFWSSILGMCMIFFCHAGCAASSIQRYMALSNEKQARISTTIAALGYVTITAITGIIGLCVYATYQYCDPVKSKVISNPTQILSLFVFDITKNIPGLSGLFSAGLLSAGLSTISAELNTVSGIVYHDFILSIFKTMDSDAKGTLIMKIVVLINGVYYLAVAPLLQYSKYLFQLALMIGGMTYGAKGGLMILGTCFPATNSIGAICGTISGILIVGWISIGSFYYGIGSTYELPVSIDNCSDTHIWNITSSQQPSSDILSMINDEPLFIYKLSFVYYSIVGILLTVLIALLVSYVTKPNHINTIDQRLLIHYLRSKTVLNQQNITMRNCRV